MKIIITSTIFSLLGVLIAPKVEASPQVYQSGQGLGVSIDKCFVQFDQNGTLLEGGRMCDDIQLHEAKKAVQEYLQQQDSLPRIYESGQGPGVAIGKCFVQFDQNGTLLEGGRMCDDIQLHEAKKAVQEYLQQK